MINWFEIIADRLTAIEEEQKELRNLLTQPTSSSETNPYGGFEWLCAMCSGIPASTLRIKSAAGEIPGVIKFGKRVLYEKAAVVDWLRSQTRQAINIVDVEQQAAQQIESQLSKKRKGGRIGL